MADIKYEITAHIGTISESEKGWTKELNLVSWNGREPKYDLREWNPDHDKMGKGITLTKDELLELKTYWKPLNNRFGEISSPHI